jgi:hypothetical protein
MKIITLTTDFGTDDWFVGTMKGVILAINPRARIVDLTHAIPPGDIRAGAFALLQAYAFFPAGTIHLVVVDPGVGSPRPAIAIRSGKFIFLGPDNGVLSLAAGRDVVRSARHITNLKLFLPRISRTFHGRDVFAPVAAHLSRGVQWPELGPRTTEWQTLRWPEPVRAGRTLRGEVIWLDRFGNAITNVPATSDLRLSDVRVKNHRLGPPATHYQAVPVGKPLALAGSGGLLEIAVNGGSAELEFALRPGTPVIATMDPDGG